MGRAAELAAGPLEIRTGTPGTSGMMAEELRCFCRVVRGVEAVPVGATYSDAVMLRRVDGPP